MTRGGRLPPAAIADRLQDHPNFGEVRGKGLMLFLELVA